MAIFLIVLLTAYFNELFHIILKLIHL